MPLDALLLWLGERPDPPLQTTGRDLSQLHFVPAAASSETSVVTCRPKTLGSIGAMTSASQRSGLEFRFERGVSLGLKSFRTRLDP